MATTEGHGGIKSTLDQIDGQIIEINNQLSSNGLVILNLKNQRSKLNSIFNVRVEETERNFKLDVETFEDEIYRSFRNHTNMTKMLEKKVEEIKSSQEELADNLMQIEQKVKNMQEALG